MITIDTTGIEKRLDSIEQRLLTTERFLQRKTAAEMLDCSEKYIDELVRQGALNVYYVGSLKRYKYSELVKLAKNG